MLKHVCYTYINVLQIYKYHSIFPLSCFTLSFSHMKYKAFNVKTIKYFLGHFSRYNHIKNSYKYFGL